MFAIGLDEVSNKVIDSSRLFSCLLANHSNDNLGSPCSLPNGVRSEQVDASELEIKPINPFSETLL